MHTHKKIKKASKNKKLNFISVVSIIALAVFSFVDLPILQMAQEIKAQTPIIRQYKIAQESPSPVEPQPVPAPAPTDMPNPEPQPAPAGQPSPIPQPAPQPQPQQYQQPSQTDNQQQFNEIKQQPKIEIPQQNFIEEGEQMNMEIIDPREVKNALRDIKRMQSELKRFVKQLKKLPNSADDISNCENLLAKLNEHYSAISKPTENESLREVLQDFWDGRYWEEVDKLRAKVELPKELNNLAKDLKKLQKLATQKSFQKLGFNMETLKARVNETQTNLNEIQAKYAAGELEDAMEAMQEFRESGHPGEIMGVMYQMKDAKQRIKSIKNKEVLELINELLDEVVHAFNEGDFREANMAMQDIMGELMKLASKYMKGKPILNDEMRGKFDRLEIMIKEKLGESGQNGAENEIAP